MKKSLLILIAAAALASRANAATYFGTATYYSATMDVGSSFNNTFTVAKFNIPEATITGITVKVIQSTMVGSFTVTNSAAIAATIDQFNSTFTAKEFTSGLGYTQTSVNITDVVTTPDWQSATVQPSSSQVFSIGSGQTFTVTDQTIASQYWAAYTGAGSVTFSARDQQNITISGDNYNLNTSNTKATTQFAVVYTYSIPEPSSALMVGLASLLCFHRRRAS